MTKQEILNYVMKTPQNTNRAVLSGMLDGLGSDETFSTAQVTITNNTGNEVQFFIPLIGEVPEVGMCIQPMTITDSEEPIIEGTTIIPTNGTLLLITSLPQLTPNNTTVTGKAEIDRGLVFITGDCTITIS